MRNISYTYTEYTRTGCSGTIVNIQGDQGQYIVGGCQITAASRQEKDKTVC